MTFHPSRSAIAVAESPRRSTVEIDASNVHSLVAVSQKPLPFWKVKVSASDPSNSTRKSDSEPSS